MRRSLHFISLSILTVLFAGCKEERNPVLTIQGGKVSGVETATPDVLIYKGIPYAAPPVGPLRWREPQPIVPWEGVKVADKFGNASIQDDQPVGGFYQHEFYQDGDPVRSEDCLYLNVWTPAAGKTEKKLPVAMYVHGGGFAHGFGHEIEFDGEAWAKRGVILVTINYRLGALGFLAHPLLTAESATNASGNQGILDQIAALKWIKNNIAQFGGDPSNVTVFGQSAGAVAVTYLCVSPLTKDLIAKAIIMSGGGVGEKNLNSNTAKAVEENEATAKEMFDHFGMTTLEQMRAYPAKDLSTLPGKHREAQLEKLGIAPADFVVRPGQVSESKSFKTLGYQSYNDLMGPMSIRFKHATENIPSSKQTTPPVPALANVRTVRYAPVIDGYAIPDHFSNAAIA